MDQIGEVSVPNPRENRPEYQCQYSFLLSADDPLPSDPDHATEDEHSRQIHERLQNLDLKEPAIDAIGAESTKHDSKEEEQQEEEIVTIKESDESDDGDRDMETEKLGGYEVDGKNRGRKVAYPLRPEAEDCAFYMKTGSCKFGSNCKFNHPVRKKNQVDKEKLKQREEPAENQNQTECKYYLRTGGCKYGKNCKYIHRKPRPSSVPVQELNFLGLPIRPGEIECPFYMRNGSCKYGATCKFNHPDPTVVAGGDPPSTHANGGSSESISSQANVSVTSWSAPRTLSETGSYVPMIYPSTHAVPSQTPEWNGYQAPLYPQEQSMHLSAQYLMNNTTKEATIYTQKQAQAPGDEFPERPGEPECSYFLRTGGCKFKFNCKYHHPKNQTLKEPPCILSDKGLPLRPDQNICTYYSRYGICKYGPACKFDHPVEPSSSAASDPDQPLNNSPATSVVSSNNNPSHGPIQPLM